MDEEATILLKTIQAMLQTVGYTLVAEPDASFIERFGAEGLRSEAALCGRESRGSRGRGSPALGGARFRGQKKSSTEDGLVSGALWGRRVLWPRRGIYYLDENNRLFTDFTREVRAAFRAHGLEFEKKNREPDDHIGLMLSFLAVLAGREAEAVEAGDEETARSLQKDQADFIDNHVLTFVDEWAAAMAEKSDSDFYAGMALLACGLVKERRAQLEGKLSGSEDAGATSGADGGCCKEAVSCAC